MPSPKDLDRARHCLKTLCCVRVGIAFAMAGCSPDVVPVTELRMPVEVEVVGTGTVEDLMTTTGGPVSG